MNVRAIWLSMSLAFCLAVPSAAIAADDQDLLSYVASDCHAAVLIRPARFAEFKLDDKPLSLLPALGQFGHPLGLTSALLAETEVLLLQVWFDGVASVPECAYIARFKEPAAVWTLRRDLLGSSDDVEILGLRGGRARRERPIALVQLDELTIAVGRESRLSTMLDERSSRGSVEQLLIQFNPRLDAIAVLDVAKFDSAMPQSLPDFDNDLLARASKPSKQMSASLQFATLQVDLKAVALRANFIAADERRATEFLQGARGYLNLIADSEVVPMRLEFERQRPQLTPDEISRQEDTLRRTNQLFRDLIPKQNGNRLSCDVSGLVQFSGLLGMLTPVPHGAYWAAMRAVATDRMQRIAAALERYRAEHGKYPEDIYDAQGKPLLSWRVVLLPYLGYEELYKQFDLKKGWGKLVNRPALEKTPIVYQHPYQPNCDQTLCVRPRSAALPTTKSALIDPVRGLVLIEAPPYYSPSWTKPSDMPIAPAEPMAGIPQAMTYGTLAIDPAGKVHLLTPSIPKADLLSLLAGTAAPAVPSAPRTAPK